MLKGITIYQGKYLSLSSVTYKETTGMLLPFIPGVILQLHPLVRHFQFNESIEKKNFVFYVLSITKRIQYLWCFSNLCLVFLTVVSFTIELYTCAVLCKPRDKGKDSKRQKTGELVDFLRVASTSPNSFYCSKWHFMHTSAGYKYRTGDLPLAHVH